MMVGCIQDELDAMKEGLNDIILSDLLSGLTAEVRPADSVLCMFLCYDLTSLVLRIFSCFYLEVQLILLFRD